MPDTRPRVVFDADGTCNGCRVAESKHAVDWNARRAEFEDLVAGLPPGNPYYDCVVPWSGGKDSSAIAHRLKFEFGLNPLLVTFSPLIPNEVGIHNREELVRLGFDHIMVRPNQKVSRKLSRRFFVERGHPKVHWDAGINAVPVQIAVNYGIPLVVYAEHGESEYGGRVLSEKHLKMRDLAEVLEHQIGDDPINWVDDEISESDLAPYLYPAPEAIERVGVKVVYFGYFMHWDVVENYHFIRSKLDFQTAPGGRTDGTFTNFDSLDDKIDNVYYYLQFIKFGFGRAVRDCSRQIQRGHIDRDEALQLVEKYDSEFPNAYFMDTLEYLGLTTTEFAEIVDMHRNDEIWKKRGNEWLLRHPPKGRVGHQHPG